ncbi:hypothetical protein MSHRCOH1_05680 [Candidatus Ornithobacterium hominis]|nr:hypothetical protein [Candidatus Ornithobacterium hominis]CAI9429683.1 hypothetical protein MSHRCOH1_05680 [Candidatus Ornithobacterium hominis]
MNKSLNIFLFFRYNQLSASCYNITFENLTENDAFKQTQNLA